MSVLRCPACGFLWLARKILKDDYYNDVDSGMDTAKNERRRRNMRERIQTFLRYIPSLDDTCDIGTGEGTFLSVLKEQGFVRCFGIDPSDVCVRHARGMGLDVVRGSIRDIIARIGGRTVRVFTLFHVVEHLEDPQADLRTLADQLPHGGYIIIETPNKRGFSARMHGALWDLYYPEHLWYFDDRTLPRFIEGLGLRIVTSGRRDFDAKGKGIRELLWRLRLIRLMRCNSVNRVQGTEAKPKRRAASNAPTRKEGAFLRLVRSFLAHFMQWSGNVDHVWVIAQKD